MMARNASSLSTTVTPVQLMLATNQCSHCIPPLLPADAANPLQWCSTVRGHADGGDPDPASRLDAVLCGGHSYDIATGVSSVATPDWTRRHSCSNRRVWDVRCSVSMGGALSSAQ